MLLPVAGDEGKAKFYVLNDLECAQKHGWHGATEIAGCHHTRSTAQPSADSPAAQGE